jgi:secreted trypsin-like serine protease
VRDAEQVPNRFVCFVKVKIEFGNNKKVTCKGSGVLLDERWVLTAAHNVMLRDETIQKLKMNKANPVDNSYVKLALHDGTTHGEYSIVSLRMSSKFKAYSNTMSDFALIEIAPKVAGEHQVEKVYPPVVALSEAAYK